MTALCDAVRELMAKGDYQECEARIAAAMGKNPHAPQPHNLIGILLEKTGDPRGAMKHFRAACALDPKYLPARRNAERVASFFVHAASAFDETDCFEEQAGKSVRNEQDKQGLASLTHIGGGRLSVAEVSIGQTAPILGKRIWEIDLPPEAIIGCIVRGELSIVPRGDTRILAGDVLVLISANRQEMPAIQKLTGNYFQTKA